MKLGFLMEGNEYSFARVTGFLVILFYMYNATMIMIKTGQFLDIPWGIATLAMMPYLGNKGAEVLMTNGANKTSLTTKDSV